MGLAVFLAQQAGFAVFVSAFRAEKLGRGVAFHAGVFGRIIPGHEEDGVFREVSIAAGVASMARSRGAALVDMNLDGLLDLAVVNRRVPMEIYQNITATDGNWLAVSLSQPGANSRAVGAWLELRLGDRIIAREITVGGGHASGAAVPEHFGLGAAGAADLRIIWPDGQQSDWLPLSAGQTWEITRTPEGATARAR